MGQCLNKIWFAARTTSPKHGWRHEQNMGGGTNKPTECGRRHEQPPGRPASCQPKHLLAVARDAIGSDIEPLMDHL
jgi:hypothetical protein